MRSLMPRDASSKVRATRMMFKRHSKLSFLNGRGILVFSLRASHMQDMAVSSLAHPWRKVLRGCRVAKDDAHAFMVLLGILPGGCCLLQQVSRLLWIDAGDCLGGLLKFPCCQGKFTQLCVQLGCCTVLAQCCKRPATNNRRLLRQTVDLCHAHINNCTASEASEERSAKAAEQQLTNALCAAT